MGPAFATGMLSKLRLLALVPLALVGWGADASALPRPLQAPRAHHDFFLGEHVGAGAWSDAYRARTETGELAIVKVFKPRGTAKDTYAWEFDVLGHFSDRGTILPKPLGIGVFSEEVPRPALALTLAPGERLRERGRPLGKAVRIVQNILDTLSLLHNDPELPIAHRDVHASNVYIDRNESRRVTLIDVGNSRNVDAEGIRKDIVNTAQLLITAVTDKAKGNRPNSEEVSAALEKFHQWDGQQGDGTWLTLGAVVEKALRGDYANAAAFREALAPFASIKP